MGIYTILISIPRTSKYTDQNTANNELIQNYFEELFGDRFVCALKPYKDDDTKAKLFFKEKVRFVEGQDHFVLNNTVSAQVLERKDEGEIPMDQKQNSVQLQYMCSNDEFVSIDVDLEEMYGTKAQYAAANGRAPIITISACHPEVLQAAVDQLQKRVKALPSAKSTVRKPMLFPMAAGASSSGASAAAGPSRSAPRSTKSVAGPYEMDVRLSQLCTLQLRLHDITKLPCELIIVTTNCSLSLRYGLAHQVASVVGADLLRQLCHQRIRERGANLNFGETFLCNLPAQVTTHFRRILFIALPNNKRQEVEPQSFRSEIRCLVPQWLNAIADASERENITVAAMPPIGYTLPHWPDPIVDFADALVDGIRRMRCGRLRLLTLCDVTERSLASLGNSLIRAFGSSACHSLVPVPAPRRPAAAAAEAGDDVSDTESETAAADVNARASIGVSGDCELCAKSFTVNNPLTSFHCNRGKLCRRCVRRLESKRSYYGNGLCVHCQMRYRPAVGNQPHGSVTMATECRALPGYEGYNTIVINYNMASGVQDDRHPSPGQAFRGTTRTAYLPANREGQSIADRLKRAFDAGLIFTVGPSATSGADSCITWNTVHHKTHRDGGQDNHGYPDPDYLRRVSAELNALGF